MFRSGLEKFFFILSLSKLCCSNSRSFDQLRCNTIIGREAQRTSGGRRYLGQRARATHATVADGGMLKSRLSRLNGLQTETGETAFRKYMPSPSCHDQAEDLRGRRSAPRGSGGNPRGRGPIAGRSRSCWKFRRTTPRSGAEHRGSSGPRACIRSRGRGRGHDAGVLRWYRLADLPTAPNLPGVTPPEAARSGRGGRTGRGGRRRRSSPASPRSGRSRP